DAFRPDRGGSHRGRDAGGCACARQTRRHRHARARQMVRPCDLGHRTAGGPALPHGVQSAPRARAERRMITLTPGRTTLADWRAVADGADVRLDPSALPAVEASARTVDAIVARGTPVYGINTGFGKLASGHLGSEDLLTLQANI